MGDWGGDREEGKVVIMLNTKSKVKKNTNKLVIPLNNI